MKVIFVDDEVTAIYNLLNNLLDSADFEYRFFKDNEEEILKYASKNELTAAFLDVNMPNVNGLELAEKLIAVQPFIKIVFITGLNICEEDLSYKIRQNFIGFLYKPYGKEQFERFITALKSAAPVLTVRTFDGFDCFIDGRLIKFSSGKAKELLALLIAMNGKALTMGEAAFTLWPDSEGEKGKTLYRDAVWRLRKTLNEYGVHCVDFQRAQISLDKQNIECDYWNYLSGVNDDYHGEFLKCYDWSVGYLALLDSIAERRKK